VRPGRGGLRGWRLCALANRQTRLVGWRLIGVNRVGNRNGGNQDRGRRSCRKKSCFVGYHRGHLKTFRRFERADISIFALHKTTPSNINLFK